MSFVIIMSADVKNGLLAPSQFRLKCAEVSPVLKCVCDRVSNVLVHCQHKDDDGNNGEDIQLGARNVFAAILESASQFRLLPFYCCYLNCFVVAVNMLLSSVVVVAALVGVVFFVYTVNHHT